MVFSSRSIFAALLSWPTELFSNVLQCFPTSRASRRESEWFDVDHAVEQENTTMDDLEVVRAWFTINPDYPPEDVVWHHSFDDVVKIIVSLPCQRGNEELAELVVPESDAQRVRRQFNIETSLPLGSRDPMVLSQKPEILALQRFEAGQKLRETYLACQAKGNLDDQARAWFHRRLKWVSEELGTLLDNIQTVRVWKTIYQGPLMRDAKNKGVEDLILAAVYLEDPCNAYALAPPSHRLDGAIQVDLVIQRSDFAASQAQEQGRKENHDLISYCFNQTSVRVGGGPRVLLKYGPVDFDPMSDKDPVVLAQQAEDMNVKRVAAYKDLAARYSRYLREECPRLDPMAKVWATERLAGIENQLSVLQPNPLVVILERGLGNVVREAIPLSLEEHINSQEWAQVDLAVDHRGVQRVGQVCELLKCQRFGDDDPVIRMQPGNDPHMKKFFGYNHVIWRYIEARKLRQTDEALTQWYEGEIGALERFIDSFREDITLSYPTVVGPSVASPLEAGSSGQSMLWPVRTLHAHNMGNVQISESSSIREQNNTLVTPHVHNVSGGILESEIGNLKPVFPGASRVESSHGYGLSEGLPAQDSNASAEYPFKISDKEAVNRYYEVGFKLLRVGNCRILAGALIMHLEPYVRTLYPYNVGEPSKPEWWPQELHYKAPSRLNQNEGIPLLIHLIHNPSIGPDDLEQIIDQSKDQIEPADKLDILYNILALRRKEEQYNAGVIDAIRPTPDDLTDNNSLASSTSYPCTPPSQMGGLMIGDAQKVFDYYKCALDPNYILTRVRTSRDGGLPNSTEAPDQLGKDGCTQLLIHIIYRLGRFEELQKIANSNTSLSNTTIEILNEIYNVRQMEEQHEQGKIGIPSLQM
ncbi:hypothetical protein EYZ11_010173 [Aspergillus tanneri]|uniref:Subtelomeric hrmA-associated cluster protein AFUB-079030/YDR124W-like helical bundle domain-containing protein n=1 Tax=Aspergillus tanneri TaxID=1220188 RepID=A0A4S3J6J3_9EURO|nr:hypothetical protein EYZ11_010173 [Aspergillus tanneri]